MPEIRSPKYSQTVVDNLRRSQSNLSEFTDDQIDKAHRNWSLSDDYPDESKLADWIDPVEMED